MGKRLERDVETYFVAIAAQDISNSPSVAILFIYLPLRTSSCQELKGEGFVCLFFESYNIKYFSPRLPETFHKIVEEKPQFLAPQ